VDNHITSLVPPPMPVSNASPASAFVEELAALLETEAEQRTIVIALKNLIDTKTAYARALARALKETL